MNKIDMEMFELCVCGVSIGCLFQACKETLEQDEPPTSSRKKSCPLVLGSVQVWSKVHLHAQQTSPDVNKV